MSFLRNSTAVQGDTGIKSSRRRAATLAASFVAALVLFVGMGASGGAAFADVVDQCNGIAAGGGQGIICSADIVNNLDNTNPVAPVTSSTVTLSTCVGAAGAAASGTCTVGTPQNSPNLITSVTQCNAATNGGGSTLECYVTITNNITGTATVVPVTVNQCNGSLTTGDVNACNPNPVTDPGAATVDPSTATVVECNNSANGGGSVLDCVVADGSTTSSASPTRVNQCNNSDNGGGSTILCRVSLTTLVLPPTTTGGGTGSSTGSRSSAARRAALSPDVLARTGLDADQMVVIAVIVLFAGAGLMAWSVRRRNSEELS